MNIKENASHKAGQFDFGGPGRNQPEPQELLILALDYFQLRFNFLCVAAQSLK